MKPYSNFYINSLIRYYKKAMDLEPENPIVLYNAGILYNIKSEYQNAVMVLEQSLEKNKENVYAYLALGDALEK